jgi:glycosyltransferase involved in cell wall biosynthesis
MKIVATMPVRNEAWVLGLTLRAALMWCDEVIVLDHASTDCSRLIVREAMAENHDGQVLLIEEPPPAWDEMAHRQLLLDCARARGATHIAILDADELVTGNLLPGIRAYVEATPPGHTLDLPQINLRGAVDRMHTSGIWAQAHTATAFRDRPSYSWQTDKGYQHHHRSPYGLPGHGYRPVKREHGGLFHLQMLDERRLRAKQLLYCLNDALNLKRGIVGGKRDTPEKIRAYYSDAVYGGDKLAPVPASWWEPYTHLMQHLRPSEEPWQLAECKRIAGEHPGILKGLDTFGLDVAITAGMSEATR